MAGKKHVHKYHKVDIAYDRLWACALPTCTHYMPKHLETMLPGKGSICWKCDEPFILDAVNMQDDKPVCPDCSNRTTRVTSALERFGIS
jgi:Zn finger protein HypA/HybF involved in hydrogenase expression